MNRLFVSLILLSILSPAARSQGLIGAPNEAERPRVQELELKRSKLFHGELKNLRTKTMYGAIVWQLADKYESLNEWQNAIAARNTLADLKLPKDAIWNCDECVWHAKDDLIASDLERLNQKVAAVEQVEHVKFDHDMRLPVPKRY